MSAVFGGHRPPPQHSRKAGNFGSRIVSFWRKFLASEGCDSGCDRHSLTVPL